MIKGKKYSEIFRNMAGFCKLVAQNWHKNLPSCVRLLGFFMRIFRFHVELKISKRYLGLIG